MKRLFLLIAVFSGAVSALAQEITRIGAYYSQTGEVVIGMAQSKIIVELRVEERSFTPGVYARYAQKYLGVRASLTSHTDTSILSTSITLADSAPLSVNVLQTTDNSDSVASTLPSNRMDNRTMSIEEQASATADMIFSLRKHRMDLITGESGENVFGAGLSTALNEINTLEKEYTEMFYGTTVVNVRTERFCIVPSRGENNYILCRYRDGVGILPLSDLSGDAIMLHIEPSESINLNGLTIADVKDKNRVECMVANNSECTLMYGTIELAKLSLPIYQYGRSVSVTVSAK